MMATCPMCNTQTDESTCPVCGFALASDATLVAPLPPEGSTSDATAVGWTAERPLPAEPDATVLSAGVSPWDEPAPWDDPASLYRSAPATPPTGPQAPVAPGYPEAGYPGADHPAQGYAPQGYAPQGYAPQGYAAAPGYPDPYGAGQYPAPYAGEPARAKSKAPLIAGVLVTVAALTAGGVLLVPRLLGGTPGSTATVVKPTTATTSAATTPVTTPAIAPAPAPAPATTSQAQPAGGASGFFTVLDSLNKKWFTANQARVFADAMAAKGGRTLVVVDSDATAGMGPGHWVVGEGLLADRATGESVCPAWGRKAGGQGTDCYTKPVAFSGSSVIAGPGRPDTPAQECQRVAPQQTDACTSAYDFLTRYAQAEKSKSMPAADIVNWWTDPGYYYSDTTASSAASIRQKLVAPTASNMEYLSGNLYSFQPAAGGGAVVQVIVPFRENRVLHMAEVTYVLVPGSGANAFRLFKVTDKRLV